MAMRKKHFQIIHCTTTVRRYGTTPGRFLLQLSPRLFKERRRIRLTTICQMYTAYQQGHRSRCTTQNADQMKDCRAVRCRQQGQRGRQETSLVIQQNRILRGRARKPRLVETQDVEVSTVAVSGRRQRREPQPPGLCVLCFACMIPQCVQQMVRLCGASTRNCGQTT